MEAGSALNVSRIEALLVGFPIAKGTRKLRCRYFLASLLALMKFDVVICLAHLSRKVLTQGNCDRSMSVVRSLSCVVRRQQFALKDYSF